MRVSRVKSLRVPAALMLAFGLIVTSPAAGFSQDRSRYPQDRGRVQRVQDHRFDYRDREAAEGWYRQHQRALPMGLRDRDRLPYGFEQRLYAGYVLDRDLRGRIHPVPRDLQVRLRPLPFGFRYALIGGHLCVLDNRYEVHDVIRLGYRG